MDWINGRLDISEEKISTIGNTIDETVQKEIHREEKEP